MLSPWPGLITAIAQTATGESFFAYTEGDDCCQQQWVGAFSADGRLVTSFGERGRASLPGIGVEGETVTQIALLDNGDPLVVDNGAHMGAAQTQLFELTPNGRLVTSFTRNLDSGWRARVPINFLGAVVAGRGGFTIIGTGQMNYLNGLPDPSEGGRLLVIDNSGRFASSPSGDGMAKFPQPLLLEEWVFRSKSGDYLMVDGPSFPDGDDISAPQPLEVVALRRDGTINKSYGVAGRGRVELPSGGTPPFVEMVTGSSTSVLVVSSPSNGRGAMLFELRT